jgi:hypothetical protein
MNAKTTALTILVIALLIAVGVANVYATYTVFTSRFPGANDFYRNWVAARMWWTQGISPYSAKVAAQIEIGMYGRRALPTEDPGVYSYPFYTVFLTTPFAFLPYAWAQAIWLTLLQFALIGSVIGSVKLIGWRIPSALLVVTAVWVILFYHGARAIILGQYAIIVYALVVAALLALYAHHDITAGVFLALSTVKPQMVYLFVPFVIFWAVARRRWRVPAGVIGAMAVLCGASWIAAPSWVGDFVVELLRYPSYAPIGSPVWIVTHYFFPALGTPTEIVLTVALVVWMFIAWWRVWRDGAWLLFMWAAGVTLVVSSLVAIRTATTNYVVLLLPFMQILAQIKAQWKHYGTWIIVGVEVALLVGLWPLFLATIANKIENAIMFLPLPVCLLVMLALWRHKLAQGAWQDAR